MLETAIIVKVNEGLHARPATQFAKLAKEFSCSLQVFRGSVCADAKSAVKLMLLGVKQEDQILLRADGSDESDAVRRLLQFLSEPSAGVALARQSAGEHAPEQRAERTERGEPATAAIEEAPDAGREPALEPPVWGVPASEGLACGEAFVYLPEELRATRQFIEPDEVAGELAHFGVAFRDAIAALNQQFETMGQRDDIVEALSDVAQSEEFSGAVKARIASGWDAAAA